MAQVPDEKLLRNFRILVAPLDWGLGHAARCIPIIKELMAHGCDIWLAGEGEQQALLRAEFPELSFLPLEGYRIRYSRKGFAWKIILQIPKIISRIRKENAWLKRMIRTYHFEAVISDNRFGLYHEDVPSIFLTHQLTIKSNLGKWSERRIQRWNYRFIDQFTECWVPDSGGPNNLAGELSHPSVKPRVPVRYIGWLSRLERNDSALLNLEAKKNNDHLLFILSGPEPQRSILENKVINDVSHYPGTATIVRGKPSLLTTIPSTGMIKFYNHLSSEDLNEQMEKADWVISRSGYSTVMDLVKLQKKAILVPTPGQTEQEYLAEFLSQRGVAFTMQQNDFSLALALDKAKKFAYQLPAFDTGQELKLTIRNFLVKLKA